MVLQQILITFIPFNSARWNLLPFFGGQSRGNSEEMSRHCSDDATADQRPTVRDVRGRPQGGDHGLGTSPVAGEIFFH